MKNQLSLFVATLATLFTFLTASAQGEWKWAHYWSGGDGSYGDYYNQITNTAFDDEGNIYVYGTMGGSPQFDGLTFLFVNNGTVLDRNDHSILLAKFDTLGNMLWYKVLKSDNEAASPRWMEVRNNKVFVAADCGFYGYQSDSWLYYWDTLITRTQINSLPQELQKPPFKAFSRWTCLAQFDLDGNLLEDHFVQAYSRESFFNGSNWLRYDYTLCQTAGAAPTPVHVDNNGNHYIYTPIQYKGTENEPFTIIVDGDSNKTYNLYLPGNTDSENSQSLINNAMLYKFSSSGELLFAKLLIDHTDGIAPTYSTGDSINRYYYTYFNGLSFDEDDNMYLTGYVTLANSLNGHGGELNNYPVHIWWDGTHYLTINDISSALACNFVVKYDVLGDVLWSNQAYTDIQQTNDFAYVRFYRSCVGEDGIYICGDAENYPTTGSMIYFENNTNNYIDRYNEEQMSRAFYAMFNKHTGEYIKNDIVPNEKHSTFAHNSASPAIANNQLVVFAITDRSPLKIGIARWNINGSFIDYHPTSTYPIECKVGPTIMNNQGNVLVSATIKGNMAFSNDVVINGSNEKSNAVFALYHNPEFTQPFVPDDSVGIDEYYQNREREIYLYPNPTDGHTTVCGYMYGYRSIELLDLQGRKLATLLDSPHGTDVPEIDLSPYPSGTYLVKINFERGVSVVRKVVKR